MKNGMQKTALIVCLTIAAVALSWAGENRAGVTVKLRFMEGIRESVEQKPQIAVATSSYLQPVFSGALAARADLEDERKQVARVFNLKDVRLITEADFPVALPKKPGDEGILHLIRLNGREYTVRLMPTGKPLVEQLEFRLEVFERAENKKTNLLDTEFRMTSGGIAVFGFETSGGAPYFLSFRLEGDVPGAVRAVGRIQPPKLIRKVEPVYPEIARQAKVDGIVILEVMTDIYGRVQNVKILRSIPLLDQAAVDAVRQWIFEPLIIEKEPRPVAFTVTVRFQIPDEEKEKTKSDQRKGGVIGGVMGGVIGPASSEDPVRAIGDIKPPKIIRLVEPVYPEEVREKGIDGIVILEAVTDIYGRVADARILKSIPELDQAAIDAVRQWLYEPMIIDGKPRPVIFTVTVRFQLRDEEKEKKKSDQRKGGVIGGVIGGVKPEKPDVEPSEIVKVVGDIKPPDIIRRVEPVYPEEAREKGIDGIVILEAVTDIYGRVAEARILRSIPELDQAAIDAVRKWIYEPLIVDGKPRPAQFTVTVRFVLK